MVKFQLYYLQHIEDSAYFATIYIWNLNCGDISKKFHSFTIGCPLPDPNVNHGRIEVKTGRNVSSPIIIPVEIPKYR